MASGPSRAPRRPNLQELVRMATESGLSVVRTEIFPDGRIVLFHTEQQGSSPTSNSFDNWKAKRDAR